MRCLLDKPSTCTPPNGWPSEGIFRQWHGLFPFYIKKRYILINLPWLPVSKHSNRTGTPAGVLYRNLSCNSVTCPDKFAALSYAFLLTLDHRTSKKKGMDKCHQISLGVRTIVGPPSTPVVRGVNSGEGHSRLLTAINEHVAPCCCCLPTGSAVSWDDDSYNQRCNDVLRKFLFNGMLFHKHHYIWIIYPKSSF